MKWFVPWRSGADLVAKFKVRGVAALARTETGTILNDICFLAPTCRVDPRLAWRPLEDRRCDVRCTLGLHQVSATLDFDGLGELTDFSSEDQGAMQPDGSLRPARWTTPMRDCREVEGRRVATRGEAIRHLPEGDFIHGRWVLTRVRFDVVE